MKTATLLLLISTLLGVTARAATVSFSGIPSTNVVNASDLLLLDSHLGGTNYSTRTLTVSNLSSVIMSSNNWQNVGTTNSSLAGVASAGGFKLGSITVTNWDLIITATNGFVAPAGGSTNTYEVSILPNSTNADQLIWIKPLASVDEGIGSLYVSDTDPIGWHASILGFNYGESLIVAGEGGTGTDSSSGQVIQLSGGNGVSGGGWGQVTLGGTLENPTITATNSKTLNLQGLAFADNDEIMPSVEINGLIEGSPNAAHGFPSSLNLRTVGTDAFANPTTRLHIAPDGDVSIVTGKLTVSSSYTSGAPSGGTASAWKLGSYRTNYVEAEVGGSAVQLASVPLVTTTSNALQSAVSAYPFLLPTKIAVIGDSIPLGSGVPGNANWPAYLTNNFLTGNLALTTNAAVSGATIAQCYANYTNYVAPLKPTTGTNGFIFVEVGLNDNSQSAANIFSGLSNLWSTAKADGWTVVAFTLSSYPALGPASNQNLESANALIRSAKNWDYLVDVGSFIPSAYGTTIDGLHFSTNYLYVIAQKAFQSVASPKQFNSSNPMMANGRGYLLDNSGNAQWYAPNVFNTGTVITNSNTNAVGLAVQGAVGVASNLITGSVGGSNLFNVLPTGQVMVNIPTATVPALTDSTAGTSGFQPNGLYMIDRGFIVCAFDAGVPDGIRMGINNPISWSSGSPNINGSDTFIFRDSAASVQLGKDAASPINQTFKAHDATGADHDGAALTIAGGQSTGTGRGGSYLTKTSLTSTTGSTANSYSTRSYQSAKFVDLTESTPTTLATITLGTNNWIGATFECTVFATDGATNQVLHSSVRVGAEDTAGTVTATCNQTDGTAAIRSGGGTLTCTYTATASTTNVVLQANAVSSLTQTQLRARWVATAINSSDPAIVTPQ